MMSRKKDTIDRNRAESGYTLVEVIVTAIIVSLFLTLFFQSFSQLESQRVALTQQAKANDIAETNLNLVTTRWNLPTSATASDKANGWNMTTLSPTGYAIQYNSTSNGAYQATLYAYPLSDGTSYAKDAVRIVSKVRYKVNGSGRDAVVVHAKYIN